MISPKKALDLLDAIIRYIETWEDVQYGDPMVDDLLRIRDVFASVIGEDEP